MDRELRFSNDSDYFSIDRLRFDEDSWALMQMILRSIIKFRFTRKLRDVVYVLLLQVGGGCSATSVDWHRQPVVERVRRVPRPRLVAPAELRELLCARLPRMTAPSVPGRTLWQLSSSHCVIGAQAVEGVWVLGARHDVAPLEAHGHIVFRPVGQSWVAASFILRWRAADDPHVSIVPWDPTSNSGDTSRAIDAEEIIPSWQLPSNAVRIDCTAASGQDTVLFHVLSTGPGTGSPHGLCRGIGEYPIAGGTNAVQ
jgi:hypothetical protein